jgi:hypothetical protein
MKDNDMTRIGKIAQLPIHIRDELNRRLLARELNATSPRTSGGAGLNGSEPKIRPPNCLKLPQNPTRNGHIR